jgi:hypothetical protein
MSIPSLLKDEAGPEPEDENEPLVTLETVHIVLFALSDGEVRERMWLCDRWCS